LDITNCGQTAVGPRTSGVVNSIRLNVKYTFKVAFQKAASEFELQHSDELFELWLNKDSTHFWKSWNSKYKKHLLNDVCINGSSDSASTAESFRVHLASFYGDAVDEVNADKCYAIMICILITNLLVLCKKRSSSRYSIN